MDLGPGLRFARGKFDVQLGGMWHRTRLGWLPDGLHVWWGDRGVHMYWSKSEYQRRVVREHA